MYVTVILFETTWISANQLFRKSIREDNRCDVSVIRCPNLLCIALDEGYPDVPAVLPGN